MTSARRVLLGDEVEVLSQDGRRGKGKVINVFSKHEKAAADIRVRFEDGRTADLSFGEFKILNK